MSNKLKILLCSFLLLPNIIYAENNTDIVNRGNDYSSDDYDASYYEDEGKLLFKFRGSGVLTSGKQKKLPKPTSNTPVAIGPLVKNGYGADTATTIFFNDNIGVELSLGFYALKTKTSSLNNIANNYNSPNTPGTRKDVYMIPLNFAPQLHIAPFGGIRPYVGLGVTGAYLFTRSKEFKINNGFGSFVQAGVDFVAKDDTIITLDVRQYHYKAKVSYKGSFIGKNTPVSSRVNLNPLMVSLGIGFRL